MFRRLITLIRKELQIVLGDKQSRMLLIMPVILQVAIFPLAATLEIKNAALAIYDQDRGPAAIELTQRLRAQAVTFTEFIDIDNPRQLNDTIEHQRALAVVRIPSDFSAQIARANGAPQLQILLDGRRTNAGQIAAGYIQQIVQDYQRDLASARNTATAPSELVVRNWFNPNLDYINFIMPSLIALITTLGVLIVTTLSVAREREQGTFDQLLVSPYTPEMIMAGKIVPAILIASFQAALILLAAVFIYHVPFQGSLVILCLGTILYALALAGVGLFVSSLCATQQQAFLGMFAFMMPAMMLSGFAAPIENMPVWLQHITWINPIRHFMEVVKAVYLKDATVAHAAQLAWPLLVICAITLTSAAVLFRKKVA
ncbi:ABC transporter permease [Ereboglobus luteus]|uniref:Transport permease protein n=1 Tax=Ereboglobus luteus TaxID=1796921 RepID=A0A2U8E738_9BACT|nr:ABC transporter permease [Ereboglobus luteus]AWI10663.1 hypothetical protein CKA38_11680 [Ereboglobus luteus]